MNGVCRLVLSDACPAPESGGIGVFFKIANDDDWAAFWEAPEKEYIVLLEQSMFARYASLPFSSRLIQFFRSEVLKNLQGTDKYKGALVYSEPGIYVLSSVSFGRFHLI